MKTVLMLFALLSSMKILIADASRIRGKADIATNETSEVIHTRCIPDQVFMYDHNICFCNGDGTEIYCKRKMYSLLTPELHRNQLQNITIECNSSSHFQIPCKSCICHESGKYAACVRSTCNKQEFLTETPNQCIPGAVFNDKCNGCICGSDGKATCTNLNCRSILFGKLGENGIQCVPKSHSIFGCNVCDCAADGRSMSCNKQGCEPMSFFHEHILNVTLKCTPGSIFNYDCHKCACSDDGMYAMCSGVQCSFRYGEKKAEDTVEKCNPGIIFGNQCNVCVCNSLGKGVCTTLECDIPYRFKYVDILNFATLSET
ncbi:hypothetical protein QAD02_024242 [Eretmocerus hayati]|uniref:Uncharacterized protein n=1 Tax=Eretmocerus hayati TaxID=131215 RepID=A0ACC2PYA1_9HYME|nr:hypothetical protein QAD02_024242 [Eretmocerus hayati]